MSADVSSHRQRSDTFPGLPLLSASAELGCDLCALLKESTLKWLDEHFEHAEKVQIEWLGCEDINMFVKHQLCGALLGSGFCAYIRILGPYVPKESSNWYRVQKARLTQTLANQLEFEIVGESGNVEDASSPAILSSIKDWISACKQPEEGIRKDASRPTRLLDMDSNWSQGSISGVRLVDMTYSEDAEINHYVALSYCWGGSESKHPPKTKRGNLHSRASGIPWHTLPLAFQQVVSLLRKLDYRYLWIDSLCIVQDDEVDCKTEVASMKDVYRNADLVVALARISNCHEGFLEREVPRVAKIPYVSSQHAIKGHVYLRPQSSFAVQQQKEVDQSEWNKRGWTFQERFLARRALIFTKSTVHFESIRSVRCDYRLDEMRHAGESLQSNHRWDREVEPPPANSDEDIPEFYVSQPYH
ncbi:HET-domain-containing protein [Lophium mytilinum]|uniref:HET-domain-containing protein n=1 Tax=Lophium mytilinum TaxID=390894 RepID=A0A6A6QUE5_9PEZI|nr:HET-domain-containing protein [Lophium mytilinum]